MNAGSAALQSLNVNGVRVASAGSGGDRVQHILWRIQHGELDGCNAGLIYLLCGINNIVAGDPPSMVARVTLDVAARLRARFPRTHVAIQLEWPAHRDAAARQSTVDFNRALTDAHHADATRDGSVSLVHLDPFGTGFWCAAARDASPASNSSMAALLPDGIHPNAEGYAVWAHALMPLCSDYRPSRRGRRRRRSHDRARASSQAASCSGVVES